MIDTRSSRYDSPILEIENLSIPLFMRLREIPAVLSFSSTVRPDQPQGMPDTNGGT